MTREHKLALIVGFSLILLVGVLISDHLSRARQAKIAPVNQSEMMIAENGVRPSDPLKNDGTTPMPSTAPITIASAPPAPGPAPASTPGQPSGPMALQNPLPPTTSGGALGGDLPGSPLTDRTSASRSGTSTSPDPLEQAITRDGGTIKTLANGQRVFQLGNSLPPAAGTSTTGTPAPTRTALNDGRTPPVSSDKLYTVQKGDTLVKIAEKTYGSPKLWHELARYNGLSDGAIRLGSKIKLPSKEALTGKPEPRTSETALASRSATPSKPATTPKPPAAKPEALKFATYTVKPGDTLGLIAQKTLGTSRRFQDIVDLNKLDDEDAISPGTVLKVPLKG